MKFDVDDKNRCRLVCVKFHLNRCRFAVAVAKCLGGSLFGTQCICERVVGKSSELLERSDDEGVRITEVCACGCNDATSRYRYCSSLLT